MSATSDIRVIINLTLVYMVIIIFGICLAAVAELYVGVHGYVIFIAWVVAWLTFYGYKGQLDLEKSK